MLKFSAKDTPYEIRAKQWRLLMPSNAPISFHDHMESNTTTVTSTTTSLAGITSTSLTSASGGSGGDINFTELGRRFSDLAPGNIQVPTNNTESHIPFTPLVYFLMSSPTILVCTFSPTSSKKPSRYHRQSMYSAIVDVMMTLSQLTPKLLGGYRESLC